MDKEGAFSQIAKNRIEFIDILKGYAIILVVMGHFLGWQYGGIHGSVPSDNNANVLFKIIYSFHMPLFFFLSGYTFNIHKPVWKFRGLFLAVLRRFCQLIIPGIPFMIFGYLRFKIIYFEWFLQTLFVISLINCFIYFLSHKVNNDKIKLLIEIILQLIIWLMIVKAEKLINNIDSANILSLRNIILYIPYFFLGYLFQTYKIIKYIRKSPPQYCFLLFGLYMYRITYKVNIFLLFI